MDDSGSITGQIENSRKRRTLALLAGLPGADEFSYEVWQFWRGASEAAREADANLIYFAGGEIDYSPQIVLYKLIDPRVVDGLIIWHPFVSHRSETAKVKAFINSYEVPVLNIEYPSENYPSLVLDEEQGMNDLLDHLIGHHGYQRIAFVGVSEYQSSRWRQEAFERAMQTRGLYNSNLVGSLETLDDRGLLPGRDYQVIVTNHDANAAAVILQLRNRGLHIPEDVTVTGVSDGRHARGTIPPLTTLRIPYRRMGWRAVKMALAEIEGADQEREQRLPLRLIIRRSCGCLDPLAEKADAGMDPPSEISLSVAITKNRSELIEAIAGGLGSAAESQAPRWAERILDSFLIGLNDPVVQEGRSDPSNAFMQTLDQIIGEGIAEELNVSRWHEAISILRKWCLPYLHGYERTRAENLWQQFRVLLGQLAARAEVQRAWQSSQRTNALREMESALLLASDLDEMIQILTDGLPQLGIQGFYMSLYEDQTKPGGWANLVLAYKKGHPTQEKPVQVRFQSYQIVPREWLLPDISHHFMVVALNYRKEHLGFIAFERYPEESVVENTLLESLQVILSSALWSIRLRQELHDAMRQAEEANQLKSRFLSMVSHELRTPLNLIVGLSELALREQARGGDGSAEAVHRYQEQIYTSGRHLDRLIRDVLDLASSQVGQMSLVKAPVDLVPILYDAASMGRQLAEQKKLDFQVDVPEHSLLVMGDKTRLRQVLLNLLSNAVKFTARGHVSLQVKQDNNLVQVNVLDTGMGITPEESAKIFDEFQRSDRASARGYGGLGLGLAITRQLVEMHGGRIWVNSSGPQSGGSTFSFTLPLLPDMPTQPGIDVAHSQMVLILTADFAGARPLAQHLAQQGFVVDLALAGDIEQRMSSLIVSPPGAVVLDLAPASEQGWDIMKQMKEHPATQDVPVLFYSLMSEQNMGAMLEMDYLNKPMDSVALTRTLERYGLKNNGDGTEHTILIVDDDPSILAMHVDMLRAELADSAVLVAHNGVEALELMRQSPPDLVLLDLMMPELDGFGVLRQMQEEQRLRAIPVIILSAQQLGPEDMDRMGQSVSAVMGKGIFTTQETIEQIEVALARNKRLGSEGQRLVRQAMAFIHENYNRSISRSDIADNLCINEQYLTRCFNKEIGVSPIVYLNRYRIQQAKCLLEGRDITVTQVALEVGFSSQSYFSRMFQRETGITPKAYQRGKRPKNN